MGNIGEIIKNERFKKNIKQVSLAKGICSVSYLSRVESNSIIASKEILNLLLKKLNIELKELSNEEEELFLNKVALLYKNSILKRDKAQVENFIFRHNEQNMNFSNSKNFYTYKLYMFRLSLVIVEKTDDLFDDVSLLISLEDKYDQMQRFIFNLNLGLYYYLQGNYYMSLAKLESSLKLLNNLNLEEWQRADFYNALSVSYLKSNDNYNAIKFTAKSLKYYKDFLIFDRAIDSYILMGIAQQKLLDYDSAEESFNLAQQLAQSMKISTHKGIISQSLGSLYAAQGRNDKAIISYNDSLKYNKKDKRLDGYLVTLLCLIKVYFKQDDSLQVIKWTQKGLYFLEESKFNISERLYFSYYYHFHIYSSRCTSSEDVILKLVQAINFFEEIDNSRYVQKYSIILGNYYFIQNKFKASSLYYQKSNAIILKQKSINSLEDL